MEDGTYRYEYDAEGNRTLRYVDENNNDTFDNNDYDVTEYTWDHRNRLVAVAEYQEYYFYYTDQPTFVVHYAYDAFDQLIGRTIDSDGDGDVDTTAVYVHNGGQIVMHYESATGSASASDLSHRYLWGPTVDQLLADETVDDGSTDDVAWALTDHQNSVRNLIVYDDNGTATLGDDSVNVVLDNVYDAYGNVVSTTGTAESLFLYTSRLFDEATGLQNNLHRWYDPATGNWLSEDPISFYGDPGNLYRYCNNSPGNWIDPWGLLVSMTVDPITGEITYGFDIASVEKFDLDNPPTSSEPHDPFAPANSTPLQGPIEEIERPIDLNNPPTGPSQDEPGVPSDPKDIFTPSKEEYPKKYPGLDLDDLMRGNPTETPWDWDTTEKFPPNKLPDDSPFPDWVPKKYGDKLKQWLPVAPTDTTNDQKPFERDPLDGLTNDPKMPSAPMPNNADWWRIKGPRDSELKMGPGGVIYKGPIGPPQERTPTDPLDPLKPSTYGRIWGD